VKVPTGGLVTRRKKLTERLPATPCTPAMRDAVFAVAEDQGRSIADIQRDAITLFLRKNGSKTIKNVSTTIEVQS
jgi:hypothetical protein